MKNVLRTEGWVRIVMTRTESNHKREEDAEECMFYYSDSRGGVFSCAGSEEKLAQMQKYRQVMIMEASANKIIGWAGKKKKDEDDSLARAKLLGKLVNSKKAGEGSAAGEKDLNDTSYDIIDEAERIIGKALIDSGALKVPPFSSVDKNRIAWNTSKLSKSVDTKVRPKDYPLLKSLKKRRENIRKSRA